MNIATPKDTIRFIPGSHIGTLRLALLLAGRYVPNSREFYTQVRKDGTRRVKCWRADHIFNSTQKEQRRLEYCLNMVYGDRYKGGYFIKGPRWAGAEYSFCIILKY